MAHALLRTGARAVLASLWPVDDDSTAKKIVRLVEALEDNDDVQDVYANFDIPEQVLEAVA